MQAMEATKGDRSVAAHLLGIGRTTLYRKLKDYKCEEPDGKVSPFPIGVMRKSNSVP
jgi:DNA-binding NtrC family response regulator